MDILLLLFLDKPLWMWLVFLSLVIALLVFDLGVLHKDDHEIGVAESLKLSAMYIILGLAFSSFIFWQMGGEATAQYLTAFVVEKTLAMDNIFVIALIFGFFAIPRIYQHRVLFWGILGVILLRGIMIGLGATIVEQYHWVLYLFAAFLIFTGIKMLFAGDEEHKIEENALIRFLKRR
ncbi:MAG: TerC family protein, partial [Pannonibacter indicus]